MAFTNEKSDDIGVGRTGRRICIDGEDSLCVCNSGEIFDFSEQKVRMQIWKFYKIPCE